jgi:predicted AAA+ superfamily ATPase
MRATLESYLQTDGLPKIVLADPLLRQPILKEYGDLAFYKDLVERYRIASPTLLRQLLKQVLEQPACKLSAHKLYNDFRSQGFRHVQECTASCVDGSTRRYRTPAPIDLRNTNAP